MQRPGKRPLGKKWPGIKWLYPGIGIKRWVLLLMAGVVALSLGLAYLLVGIYRNQPLPGEFYYVTLQFLPRWLRASLFIAVGGVFVAIGLYQLNHSLIATLMLPDAQEHESTSPLHPGHSGGPRVVAVGGGHGLSTLLRGLKNHTDNLTAIVTVADNGGSSGLLRQEMGLLPPGDLRNCIVALAQAEPLMTQLFQYRFGQGASLKGHAFGNLFIAAMAEITGSFEGAITEISRVLAVQGRILPSSLENVTLCAEIHHRDHPDETPYLVLGESEITEAKGVIDRVYLHPDNVRGYPEAIRALLHADLIVLGPGSLYTSILPNLLVSDIRNAVKASRALKVYACNVATQPGETDDYSIGDHVRALSNHLWPDFCHYVVANSNTGFELPPASGSVMVRPEFDKVNECRLVLEDIVDRDLPWRHDSGKLATAIMCLYAAYKADAFQQAQVACS